MYCYAKEKFILRRDCDCKKQLNQLSTLKDKVSLLTRQWEGDIGANLPGYTELFAHVERIEKQIHEQIGSWKRIPTV